MKNFKLRELSPIVISVIILSIFLVGLTSAAVSNGKIGDLFFFDTLSLKYKLYGTNVLPIFGTQNITTTGFIKGKNGKFTNKVTSASTVVLDSGTILTTKDYVESFANNAANSAKDNLGNHIATQDLNMSGSKIINISGNILTNNGSIGTNNGSILTQKGNIGTGNGNLIIIGNGTIIGKITSSGTVNGDLPTTLTTKDYVDSKNTDTWITTQTCITGEVLNSVGKTGKTCVPLSSGPTSLSTTAYGNYHIMNFQTTTITESCPAGEIIINYNGSCETWGGITGYDGALGTFTARAIQIATGWGGTVGLSCKDTYVDKIPQKQKNQVMWTGWDCLKIN